MSKVRLFERGWRDRYVASLFADVLEATTEARNIAHLTHI